MNSQMKKEATRNMHPAIWDMIVHYGVKPVSEPCLIFE